MASKRSRIIFICSVAALGGFVFGYDAVIISGTLSLFKAQFALSSIQEGMFVNSALIGTALGTIFSGRISDHYGRRTVLFGGAVLIVISVLGCTFLNEYSQIWLARFVGGFGTGMTTMVSPLYIAEITPKDIRGRMVSFLQLSMTIGGATATVVNVNIYRSSTDLSPFTDEFVPFISDFLNRILIHESWRSMFGSELIFALVFLLLIFMIPESPRWLSMKDRRTQAKAVLERLVEPEEVEQQLREIDKILKENVAVGVADLMKTGLKKPLFLAMFFCFMSEISGITAIVYYGPTILVNAGFSLGDSLGSFIYFFIINLLGCSLAILYVDRIGRRPLLLAGTVGAIITLTASGFMLTQQVQGFPIVLTICGYIFSYAFAMGPIKLVFASEVFPLRLRGIAVALSMSVIWITGILINQLFPMVRDAYSTDIIFYAFALFLIPQIFVVIFLMPETKGKSLEEIERILLKPN
ncbi:MAG: sugar porter family MFS transporter [Saprospiraceae bacterium]|nr:sugar porter family MFS transporter [Saprospiraceae bacterium]